MNTLAVTLLEATLTLYQADPSGAPITSAPIWMGVAADYVQISDHWLKVETKPTGAKYPKRHPLVPQYEISIARVWALPISDLVGFRPVRGNYVLDIKWVDDDTGDWHRETFYGVTISERSRGSRELDSHAGEFTEQQVFDAQEMVPATGVGAVPDINADLPYTVRYVSVDGHSTNIYSYNPATKVFAAIGDPSTMAVLVADSTSFKVTFSGSDAPEMQMSLVQMDCNQVRTGAPTANNVPRVDFYYGTSRIASVTRWSEVFSQSFLEGILTPQNPAGIFQLMAGGVLVGTIEQARITAAKIITFTPNNVVGLKLWCDISSFAATEDGTRIANWPDLSGNGKPLLQATAESQPLLSRAKKDAFTSLLFANDGLPSVLFDNYGPNIITPFSNGAPASYDVDHEFFFRGMVDGETYILIFGPNDTGAAMGAHGGGGDIDNPGTGIPFVFVYHGDDVNDTTLGFVGTVHAPVTAQLFRVGQRFMETASNVLQTRQFTIFMLAWQQKDSGSIVNTGFKTPNNYYEFRLLRPLGTNKLAGDYIGFDGGDGQTNPVASAADAMPAFEWQILEFNLAANEHLSASINGSQVFTEDLTGQLLPDDGNSGNDNKPICLGRSLEDSSLVNATEPTAGDLLKFSGYVRALIVYGAALSDSDKEKVRKYLGLLYSPSIDNVQGGGRDIITP